MLKYSFSTVMMTVLTSSLLIWMLVICLRYKGILRSIGIRLAIAFLLIAMLRLFLPFELPFCRNVYLPGILSEIAVFLQHPYFFAGRIGISIWFFLQCIWALGTAFSLYRLFLASRIIRRHVRRYGVDVSSREPYRSVFLSLCTEREAVMPILLVPGLDAPRQDRILHPRILLPAEMTFSQEQLRFVLQHELTHARHRDVLVKLLLNLLAALYWWNPLIRPLRRQADVLLEMRVDDNVLSGGDRETRSGYVSTLMEVAAQAMALLERQPSSKKPISSSPMASGSTTDLEKRLLMMYDRGKPSVPLTILLLTLTLSVSGLSYAVILEGSTKWPQPITAIQEGAQEMNYPEMYALEREEGGYDIYWNGAVIDHVDEMTYYSQIPVIER